MPNSTSAIRNETARSAIRIVRGAWRVTLAVLTTAVVLWAANGIRFLANPVPRIPVSGALTRQASSDPLLALAGEGKWSFHTSDQLQTGLFPQVEGVRVLCQKRNRNNQASAQLIRLPKDLSEVRSNLEDAGWRWEDLPDDFQSTRRLSRNNQSMRLVDFGSKDSYRILLVVPDQPDWFISFQH